MLEYLSIVMFLIAVVYVLWNLMADKIGNDEVVVNALILLSFNICAAALLQHLSFTIICCCIKMVVISIIITEYQLKSIRLPILVNGKFVNDGYILKPGDVVESGDVLRTLSQKTTK